MSSISWTDGVGAATLSNAFIYPGNRFKNWTPANKPFGERSHNLATGALNVTAFRDDLTVALEIPSFPNSDMPKALRLQMHLKRGGSVTLVTTPDVTIPVFGTCKLAPGADVQIQLSDKAMLEYTLSTVLRGSASSLVWLGGTDDFILWLKSDVPAWPSLTLPADGATIAQWNDVTGNNNHGVAPTALGHPRFDEDIQNGLPGVFFDADNLGDPSFDPCDRIQFADDVLVDLPEGEAFFALKLLADPPTNSLYSGLWQFNQLSDPLSRTVYPDPVGGDITIAFGGAKINIGPPPVALDKAHILNVTASPSEMTFRFNGIVVHTQPTGWDGFPNLPAGSAFATLGGDSDAFASLMGWGFEFVFMSPVPITTRRAAFHSYLSNKLDIPLGTGLVEVLVIGGGGSGGHAPSTANCYSGGGGGAGGYVYRPKRVMPLGSFPVVVGAGGVGTTTSRQNGSDSSFDDLVATGGGAGAEGSFDGGGGFPNNNGSNGGSGGGGSRGGSGGAGSQGNAGGAGDVGFGSGGSGGGAGAAGTHSGSNIGAAGGAGTANSISGASVTRSGGGGSGGYSAAGGAGGTGGGGAGGGDRLNGVAASANTGGGGGGGGSSVAGVATAGGNGGSGIVIIKYVTTAFGACTGGTITTDGIYTVHTFTSNGNFVVLAA